MMYMYVHKTEIIYTCLNDYISIAVTLILTLGLDTLRPPYPTPDITDITDSIPSVISKCLLLLVSIPCPVQAYFDSI